MRIMLAHPIKQHKAYAAKKSQLASSYRKYAYYHNIGLSCYKDDRRVIITAGNNGQETNSSGLICCPKNATNIRQGK